MFFRMQGKRAVSHTDKKGMQLRLGRVAKSSHQHNRCYGLDTDTDTNKISSYD